MTFVTRTSTKQMSRPPMRGVMTLASLLLLLTAFSLPAYGQGTPPANPRASTEITEEKLKAFASASLSVRALNEKWQPRIAGATNDEAIQRLREEAMDEMVNAVEDEGLSAIEYNEIAEAARTDPEIAETVEKYRREAQ